MEERSIEEIQQYLLEEFDRAIDCVIIDNIYWEKTDNISFKQFMLDNKETLKKAVENRYQEGCTEYFRFDVNDETFTDYYKVEDIEELISVDDELYIKHIEFWMKCTAVSYLNDCCRDHTYQYNDIVMD